MSRQVLVVDIPAFALHVHVARTGHIGHHGAVSLVHAPVPHQSRCVGSPCLVARLIQIVCCDVGVPYRHPANHTLHAVTANRKLAVTAEVFHRQVSADVVDLRVLVRHIEHCHQVVVIFIDFVLVAHREVYPLVFRQSGSGSRCAERQSDTGI